MEARLAAKPVINTLLNPKCLQNAGFKEAVEIDRTAWGINRAPYSVLVK
jgi:hypothetical protein